MIGNLARRILALDPHSLGSIHRPAVVGCSEPRSQSTLNFWGVTLHRPPDGDVVDRKSARLGVLPRRGRTERSAGTSLQAPISIDPSLVSFTEPDSSAFFSAVLAGLHAGCRKLFGIVLAGATD